MSNKLSKARKKRTEDFNTSLAYTQYINSEQALIDSANAQNEKINTIQNNLDNIDGIARSLDNLNELLSEENKFAQGPLLGGLSPSESEEALQGIKNLTMDLAVFEASTDISDDYAKFNNQINLLLDLHSEYQPVGSSVSLNRERILDDTFYRFEDVNKLDAIIGAVLHGENEGPIDQDIARVTLARSIDKDKEVHKLVYGYNSNADQKHYDGFMDIAKFYNLYGEGVTTPYGNPMPRVNRMYESLLAMRGEQNPSSELLTEALIAKRNGIDYFTDSEILESQFEQDFRQEQLEYFENIRQSGGLYGMPDTPIRSKALSKLNEGLAQLEPSQRELVKKTMQGFVDDISLRISSVEDYYTNEYFNDFEKLKNKFSHTPVGGGFPGEGPRKIDPMLDSNYRKLQEKTDDLYKAKVGYERLTGDKVQLFDILNEISIQTLNEEIDKLPDEEQTDNFNELLIELSNRLQQNPGTIASYK
jgi:predicted CopG family antitoxin